MTKVKSCLLYTSRLGLHALGSVDDQYEGFCINILDTPGHQDFSEDTYRTLMAADSAVMVIDGAKGVEPQTRKLFKICAMRHIPIFTFINKMDRETKDPFDLLDEVCLLYTSSRRAGTDRK